MCAAPAFILTGREMLLLYSASCKVFFFFSDQPRGPPLAFFIELGGSKQRPGPSLSLGHVTCTDVRWLKPDSAKRSETIWWQEEERTRAIRTECVALCSIFYFSLHRIKITNLWSVAGEIIWAIIHVLPMETHHSGQLKPESMGILIQ